MEVSGNNKSATVMLLDTSQCARNAINCTLYTTTRVALVVYWSHRTLSYCDSGLIVVGLLELHMIRSTGMLDLRRRLAPTPTCSERG